MAKPNQLGFYKWAAIQVGVGVTVASVVNMPWPTVDLRLLLLAVITIVLSSRFSRRLPDPATEASVDFRLTADIAERAERERAEQAERHVEELSRFIAEEKRISRALEENREHFRLAAFHDALTTLPNRPLLIDHLKLAIERSKFSRDYLFVADSRSFGLIRG